MTQPFHAALLRLTALYVAILMALALACSVWLYSAAGREVRIIRGEVTHLKPSGTIPLPTEDASKGRLLQELIFFNMAIFGAGTLASYALARRTLKPIQESYHAQAQFAADASHELRTPLTALKTELQLAKRDAVHMTPARYNAVIDSSLEEVERLSSLTVRLLRLTNPQGGNVVVSTELQPALDTTLKHLQKQISAKKITVVPPAATDQLAIHEGDLTELLTIILDNAVQYSPQNGAITIKATQSRTGVTITVQDEGPGIAPQDLPHIFERFYRGAQPKTHTQPGHGLGLSVARKIAHSARGTVSAKSTVGEGATFIITLPRAISG